MFIFQVHHHIKPESVEAYKKATLQLAQSALGEGHLQRLEILQDRENATHFIVQEMYQDKEARVAHLASASFATWRDAVFDTFSEMPQGGEFAVVTSPSSTPAPTTPKRLNISSGAKWEDIVGYCRAVRVGSTVEVAGTTAVDEKGDVVGETPYEQTKFILQKIERALQQTGAELKDVIRTRTFVTDISKWEEVGRAHGEFFRDIKPVATMVEVSALIDRKLLVEIEVTARIV